MRNVAPTIICGPGGIGPKKLVITESKAVALTFAELAVNSRLTESCRRFCYEIADRV